VKYAEFVKTGVVAGGVAALVVTGLAVPASAYEGSFNYRPLGPVAGVGFLPSRDGLGIGEVIMTKTGKLFTGDARGTTAVVKDAVKGAADKRVLTGLDGPFGVGVDNTTRKIYISNFGGTTDGDTGSTVSVFDGDATTPNAGETLTLPTGVTNPGGVAVDQQSGEVYVTALGAGFDGSKVYRYQRGATTPDLTLEGNGTASIDGPIGVAVASDHRVVVSNNAAGAGLHVALFDHNATTPSGKIALPPISGSDTGALGGVAFDAAGNLYVARAGSLTGTIRTSQRVSVFDADQAVAGGVANPERVLSWTGTGTVGSVNNGRAPIGVVVDNSGRIFVGYAALGQPTVAPFTNGDRVTVFNPLRPVEPLVPLSAAQEGNGIRVTVSPNGVPGGSHGLNRERLIHSVPSGGTCVLPPGIDSCVVPGLLYDTPYGFYAENVNGAGSSSSSESAPVTLTGVPGAPGELFLNPAGLNAVTVYVSGGGPLTGSAATSFKVTADPSGKSCTVTGAAGSCTISGLRPGTYVFLATATNTHGTSDFRVSDEIVVKSTGAVVKPKPKEQKAKCTLPKKLKKKGSTVLVKKTCVTTAGKTVKVSVKAKKAVATAQKGKKGKLSVKTKGKRGVVTVTLTAPAKPGFKAFKLVKKYKV